MAEQDLSIIIVSYNTSDKLMKCLSCLDSSFEIIVVDNASSDDSVEKVRASYPHVHLIVNAQNRGFGAANNQGMEAAKGAWILLLNSDAYAKPGSIQELVKEAEKADAVVAGGKLLNPDDSIQNSSSNELTLWAVFCEQFLLEKIAKNSKLFSPYWNTPCLQNQTQESFQVMGACLLMRPLERFDERFFLYCEDTELCYRMKRHGKIVYVPSAPFTHDLGSSSSNTRWQSIARYNAGKELYFRIHQGQFQAAVCWILNRKGAALRLLLWGLPCLLTLGLLPRFRSQAACFAKVLFAPIAGPRRPST